MLARLQLWLWGHPNKHRPSWVARIGNWISELRYWAWRAGGGSYADEKADMLDDLLGEDWDYNTASTNATSWTYAPGSTTTSSDG